MTLVVSLFGTGDAYLVSSLVASAGLPVTIAVKESQAVIPALFGLSVEVNDELVRLGETDENLHREWDNVLVSGETFYAHPRFERSHVQIDRFSGLETVTQADLYRALLGLKPDQPLMRFVPPLVERAPGTVLLIPTAPSWPATCVALWAELAAALRDADWHVLWNDPAWSLKTLFERCAAAEWVIGPQCGVMAILCHSLFPCRKTFLTPSVDDGVYDRFPARTTVPYAYVTRFAGEDYDVEELVVRDVGETIAAVLAGPNALRSRPHDPWPVTTVAAPLTVGEFLDRLAVLTVKADRLPALKRAVVARELTRYREIYRQLGLGSATVNLFERLVLLHGENYDVLEKMVSDALGTGKVSTDHHVAAMRSNRERVEVKREINERVGSPYLEVKSYYADGGADP